METMNKLLKAVQEADRIAIGGHVRPDGDCIGSCMGLYLYLLKQYPEKKVHIYLEDIKEGFSFVSHLEDVRNTCNPEEEYDLTVILDTSAKERIGIIGSLFDQAAHTLCIDHHISNTGYAEENIIRSDAGSASEVLFELLEEEKIDRDIAAPIYAGIAHDTGVFQFSCTTARTMEIAGKLMNTGIDFTKILDSSFYSKSYAQNQILGRCLVESILVLEGRCIVAAVQKKEMGFYRLFPKDLDGIVNQLRVTRGVEVAVFLYETGNCEYKVSLRSNGRVDVNAVASHFGGGGHILAAGCTMQGTFYDVVNSLTLYLKQQLKEEDEV